MVTGMASVTVTFLAQEILASSREIPKDQGFLFAGIDHEDGLPVGQLAKRL
jgi:hypothetical protein